jgi:putative membrane-bound dehydrogenase-like protein
MNRLWIVARVLLLCVAPAARGDSTPSTQPGRPVGPLSPQGAITSFELEPGLAVQLVAGEPLVASPCAVTWDEHGRMFIAENRGYPLGGQGGKPVGGIALLEDTDGDGLPDKRSEFATGLSFPCGLLPWRGGLIVADAPDIIFLKDADGDGQADVRAVLLTGFSTAKTTQLRVNAPTLGPDGWVYLAGGLVGGKIHSPKRPGHMLDLTRTDVKFRPDTGEMEPVEGKGQFGLTFDDAGHRFVCYNRVQVQHAPMPPRYLARNKHVASPGVLQNCPELVRNPLLGAGNDAAARIFPISSNLTTADSHAGTYSAACAVHIARGDALPTEYVGRAWSCDPTGNLVRYDALEPVGGSFYARRVRDNVEAFRSRDDWFRPVFLADGPDGALYVCDMYRRTIEHPEYLPEEAASTRISRAVSRWGASGGSRDRTFNRRRSPRHGQRT